MLFNIYETDFNDETINNKINNYLFVYDYCYALLNLSSQIRTIRFFY